MDLVIRDFSSVLGVDGDTFAIVHVANNGRGPGCDDLDKFPIAREAYLRQGSVVLSGSEFTYQVPSVEAAEAAHRGRYEVDFLIRRHECVERHAQWLAEQMTTAPIPDDTRVIYSGTFEKFHGERLLAARCNCPDDCNGYQLEHPDTGKVFLRHVRRQSIRPVTATSTGPARGDLTNSQ